MEEDKFTFPKELFSDMKQLLDPFLPLASEAMEDRQPTTYEDEPINFSFDRKIDWVEGEILLHAKACQRHRCQPPEFTEEEQEERSQIIELLGLNKVLLDHCSEDTVIEVLSMPRNEFHALLFMLARCGDESAFLELLSRDATFISHPFFSHSLKGWKVEAREGNELAKDVLKKMGNIITRSILVDAGIKSRGGQINSEVNARRCNQYWEMVAKTPEKEDTDIFKRIARRELDKEKKEKEEEKKKLSVDLPEDLPEDLQEALQVDPITREKVGIRTEAIRKFIQRNYLHHYRQGRAPNSWGYKYLKEKY